MSLKIRTFSNATNNGSASFKALSHPLVEAKVQVLLAKLTKAKAVAVYDPLGQMFDFEALYDLSNVKFSNFYVQNVADMGREWLGFNAEPITSIGQTKAEIVFVAGFDAERMVHHIRHMLPVGVEVLTLDELRIPTDMLTNKKNYLDNLNFATNFAFFRDASGHHTRVVTANYWAGYGAKNTSLWLCLFDQSGKRLVDWHQPLSANVEVISIDSKEIRKRFGLGEFTGSLYIHAINVIAHDNVKYALDTYGDDDQVLSCTHDANSWPADLYSGLPAPAADEKITLWIQNSYPCAIPANVVGLNKMGSKEVKYLDRQIAPFEVYPLDVGALMPDLKWPDQLEIQAGRHFVRPRYEIIKTNGRQRIAHVNVERIDLKSDPNLPGLSNLMGKGYLLPAPILPMNRFRSIVQPTPVSTAQQNLPLALLVYDAKGVEVLRHRIGKLERKDSIAVNISDILQEKGIVLEGGFGHMELIYDFAEGGEADGWLHALFRYEDLESGQSAETSFGAHIFNTVMVYKSQPHSYIGKPPGLSTRLFLRVGHNLSAGVDTLCHLVYPASTPWHSHSETDIVLFDKNGTELLKKHIQIPCSGSVMWRYSEMFTAEERKRAGDNSYVMIRDVTCRLFGYHGLINDGKSFCLDHMFGF